MLVFGFAAAGSAGKASDPTIALEAGAADVGREVAGEGRRDDEADEAHGVGPTLPGPLRLADKAGNG